MITWLKTNQHLNKIFTRWLDEIEDFRFDVTHLQGSRNPTDPLSRRVFAYGDDPAASTYDADAESQQELFTRLGRDSDATVPIDPGTEMTTALPMGPPGWRHQKLSRQQAR